MNLCLPKLAKNCGVLPRRRYTWNADIRPGKFT